MLKNKVDLNALNTHSVTYLGLLLNLNLELQRSNRPKKNWKAELGDT